MGRLKLRSEEYQRGYWAGYSAAKAPRSTRTQHSTVRFRGEYELQCRECSEFWPLTDEFWDPVHGMWRCRACLRAYAAARQRGYMASEAAKEARREANAVKYWANRDERLAANRAYKAAHREQIAAYNKAYREKNKGVLRERRAYKRRNPHGVG